MPRRRSIPHTFTERIKAEKARLEGQAARLRRGPKKDVLLEKIRQLETAAQINEWLSLPNFELQSPLRSKATSAHISSPRSERSRGRPLTPAESVQLS